MPRELRIWGLGPTVPGPPVIFKRRKASSISFRDLALSSFWLSCGRKTEKWKQFKPWNGFRVVPETVSTCRNRFYRYNFTRNFLETVPESLEPAGKNGSKNGLGCWVLVGVEWTQGCTPWRVRVPQGRHPMSKPSPPHRLFRWRSEDLPESTGKTSPCN